MHLPIYLWFHSIGNSGIGLGHTRWCNLIEALRLGSPSHSWDPLIRAAALGQLAHQAEAGKAVAELLALMPDFESRGRNVLKRMVFLDENVEMLLVGLRKAGLDVSR